MKLPIKQKYFDLIKSGKKDLEWRDAHITFVCEETGETIRKEIISAVVVDKDPMNWGDISPSEIEELFEDERVIGFALKDE